jgi:hypothetical protein
MRVAAQPDSPNKMQPAKAGKTCRKYLRIFDSIDRNRRDSNNAHQKVKLENPTPSAPASDKIPRLPFNREEERDRVWLMTYS